MAATAVFLDSFSSTSTVSTYSKTVVASAVAADRLIVIAISGRSGGTPTVTSVDVGGVAATQVPNAFFQNSGNIVALWYAAVPTGNSLAVTVNFSAPLVRGGFGVYAVTGASVPTVGAAGNTQVNPISVIADMSGVAIAAGFATGANGAPPFGGQRTTSSMGSFVAGTVSGRVATTATTGAVWQGNFTVADYDTMLANANANPSATAFGLFYDAAGVTVSSGTAAGSGNGTAVAAGSSRSISAATAAGSVIAAATGAAIVSGTASASGSSIVVAVGRAISRGLAAAFGMSTGTATTLAAPVDPAANSMLRIPLVPVDNASLDWPRKVANAVNALIKQFTRTQTNPFMQIDGEPMTPAEGQTYYDTGLKKVRTFNGTTWNNHW